MSGAEVDGLAEDWFGGVELASHVDRCCAPLTGEHEADCGFRGVAFLRRSGFAEGALKGGDCGFGGACGDGATVIEGSAAGLQGEGDVGKFAAGVRLKIGDEVGGCGFRRALPANGRRGRALASLRWALLRGSTELLRG